MLLTASYMYLLSVEWFFRLILSSDTENYLSFRNWITQFNQNELKLGVSLIYLQDLSPATPGLVDFGADATHAQVEALRYFCSSLHDSTAKRLQIQPQTSGLHI